MLPKVTTKLLSGTGGKTGAPALWNVLLDGKPINPSHGDASQARVLESPWGCLPVIDGADAAPIAAFSSRRDAAIFAALIATGEPVDERR